MPPLKVFSELLNVKRTDPDGDRVPLYTSFKVSAVAPDTMTVTGILLTAESPKFRKVTVTGVLAEPQMPPVGAFSAVTVV